MRHGFITSERLQLVADLVSKHDGEITRRQIGEALGLSEGPTSLIVNAAIEDGLIASTGFKRNHQAVLYIPKHVESHDWFAGWNGAPCLGLANWH